MKHLFEQLKHSPTYQQLHTAVSQFTTPLTNKHQCRHVIMETMAEGIQQYPELHLRHQDQDLVLRIRLAEDTDLSQIDQVQDRAYQGQVAWNYADFVQDWYKNPYAVYLVIEAQVLIQDSAGDPAPSHLIAGIIGRFRANDAHISQLFVDPDYQGQGLGSLLIQIWQDQMACFKIGVSKLEVRQSNTAAQRLYRRHGYYVYDQHSRYYYDNHETALLMKYQVD